MVYRSICSLLIVDVLFVVGCQTGPAGPGHEMNATGIESQVSD